MFPMDFPMNALGSIAHVDDVTKYVPLKVKTKTYLNACDLWSHIDVKKTISCGRGLHSAQTC